MAWIGYWLCINWYSRARFECIASKAFKTVTAWRVIDDTAQCIRATNAWAWIATFCVDASLVGGTFAVHDTLWSTRYVRVAVIIRNASARSSIIQFFADSIDTARVSGAGCFVGWQVRHWKYFVIKQVPKNTMKCFLTLVLLTLHEGVASITVETSANGNVRRNHAVSVEAA